MLLKVPVIMLSIAAITLGLGGDTSIRALGKYSQDKI